MDKDAHITTPLGGLVAFAALVVCAALASRIPATAKPNASPPGGVQAPAAPAAIEIGINGACAAPTVLNGSITLAGSPTQTGRLLATDIPGVCGQTTSCAVYDSSTYPYQQFDFHNNSTDAQCMTATLDARNCANRVFSTAYLNSHNASNICQNYLSAIGHSTDNVFTYSFLVPGLAYFSIVNNVINDADPSLRVCGSYTLSVRPCSTNVSVVATQTLAGPATVTANANGTAVITYNLSYKNTGNYTVVVPSSNVVETALAQPPNYPVLSYGRAGGIIAPGGTTTQSVAVEATNGLLNTCVPTTYTLTARLNAQASVYGCNWGNSIPPSIVMTGTLLPDNYLDEDSYGFTAQAGWNVTVTVETLDAATTFDPKACISDTPHGACLLGLYNDDAIPCGYQDPLPSICPRFNGNLPPVAGGIYYLRVNPYSTQSFAGTIGRYRATITISTTNTGLCPLVQVLDNGSRAFLAPTSVDAADAITSAITATSPPVTVILPASNPASPSCVRLYMPIMKR
ncbi:MAG: hypothetical protein M1434_01890 [Chloroflexi bacterium]|nr:hypothetical protein [Chloroflexota bacterium]MCL5273480.1 hypothetical protein [Chloroflexota bacterium]